MMETLDALYFSQVDNKWFPGTACYPSSMATAIRYCLDISGFDKTEMGCPPGKQLEDFISEITVSPEIKQWIKDNVSRYGSWMLKYKPRTIAKVEEHIFNNLMYKFGFKCQFREDLSFNDYCHLIKFNKLPIVLHGRFGGRGGVFGHIVCGIGYKGDKIIVHDPFGNVEYDKYKSHEFGAFAEYPQKYFLRKGKMLGQIISRG